jgi:hypothetical protein
MLLLMYCRVSKKANLWPSNTMRTNDIRKVYQLNHRELCCVERLFFVIRVNDCEHLAFIWCFIRSTLCFEIPLSWSWNNSYVRDLNVAGVQGRNKRVFIAYERVLVAVLFGAFIECKYTKIPLYNFSKCIARVKSAKWVDVQLILLKVENTWIQDRKSVV